MRQLTFMIEAVLVGFIDWCACAGFCEDCAVSLHRDIIPIRGQLKYTTLIELPTTEKIMQAATGDKEFWIVDVVGNFCFVHPAKKGISSHLNLITDKGTSTALPSKTY